jgi:hypothetical protein
VSGAEPGEAGAVIEVWQAPDRLWRWRYLEPSGDGRALAFLGNKEYESREAALRSATTAYPEVTAYETTAAAVASHPGRRAAERPEVTDTAGRRRVHLRDPLLVLGLAALAVVLVWLRRGRSRSTKARRGVPAGGGARPAPPQR